MAQIGKLVLNDAGTIIEVDPAFCMMLHAAPAELIGRNALEMTAPADQKRCEEIFDTLLADQRPVSTVKRLVRLDGSHVWVDHALSYIADTGDGPTVAVTSQRVNLPAGWVEPNKLLRIAKFIEQSRRLRAEAFNRNLFTDPAWDIILLAYICEAEGDVVDPRTLFATIGIGVAAGSRWVRALMAEGLVECADGDQALVTCPLHLTAAAHERLERYLADLYNTLTPADRLNMPA